MFCHLCAIIFEAGTKVEHVRNYEAHHPKRLAFCNLTLNSGKSAPPPGQASPLVLLCACFSLDLRQRDRSTWARLWNPPTTALSTPFYDPPPYSLTSQTNVLSTMFSYAFLFSQNQRFTQDRIEVCTDRRIFTVITNIWYCLLGHWDKLIVSVLCGLLLRYWFLPDAGNRERDIFLSYSKKSRNALTGRCA